MSLDDIRPYSLAFMAPLCMASAAFGAMGSWNTSFLLDFLMALILVDHVAHATSEDWSHLKSLSFTVCAIGAGCLAGMAVLEAGLLL